MGSGMIYLFLSHWLAGWIIAYRLKNSKTALTPSSSTKETTIIIPARNEAHNLPRLLDSIHSQSQQPNEIIVVDDDSSDATAEVALTLGAKVISSPPLPTHWRGKPWACHQGALTAKSEWFLFLDADTWFENDGLSRILKSNYPGVLSITPYHAVSKTHEDFSLFFNTCMNSGTVPDGLSGQFLFIHRDAYQKTGGHESVSGCVLENFKLSQYLREANIPILCLPGKGIFSFRMYPHGFGEIIQGWTKGFASGASGTRPCILTLIIVWMSSLMLAPLAGCISGDWITWGIAYVMCMIQVSWIARKIGSFGWFQIALYPIPLLFFFVLFAWSTLKSGKKVWWKGREIHAD